ncbi:P35 family lipoprotein [Malacoplasma iowae]|uniref:P35 family lipoprotein n=1 Tax=Malacoplasma iowae TaxID=2116 RepID=UPI002A189A4D|nr:P35 family lipoprotein [Malacoplasma iowae]WPL40092.1 P35 family lipoprotein [Malacoplasma iowae]
MEKKKKNKLKKILLSISSIGLLLAIPTAVVLSLNKPTHTQKKSPDTNQPKNDDINLDKKSGNHDEEKIPNDNDVVNKDDNDNNTNSDTNDEKEKNNIDKKEENKDNEKEQENNEFNIDLKKDISLITTTDELFKNNDKKLLEDLLNKDKKIITTLNNDIQSSTIYLSNNLDFKKTKTFKQVDLTNKQIIYFNNNEIIKISNIDDLFKYIETDDFINKLIKKNNENITYKLKDKNDFYVDKQFIYFTFNELSNSKVNKEIIISIPLSNIEINLKDIAINLTKENKTITEKVNIKLNAPLSFSDIDQKKQLLLIDYNFNSEKFKVEVLKQLGLIEKNTNDNKINYSKIADKLKLFNSEIKDIKIITSSNKAPGTKGFDNKYDIVLTIVPKQGFHWEDNTNVEKQLKMKNINIVLKTATWENVGKYYNNDIKLLVSRFRTNKGLRNQFKHELDKQIIVIDVQELMKDDLKKWNMDVEFVDIWSDFWSYRKAYVRMKLVPLPGYTYEYNKYENEAYFTLEVKLGYGN